MCTIEVLRVVLEERESLGSVGKSGQEHPVECITLVVVFVSLNFLYRELSDVFPVTGVLLSFRVIEERTIVDPYACRPL